MFPIMSNKLTLMIFSKCNSLAQNTFKIIFKKSEKVDNRGLVVFICIRLIPQKHRFSLMNKLDLKQTNKQKKTLSFSISQVLCHLYCNQCHILLTVILTGSRKQQGEYAKFEFGASPLGAGEKGPEDQQHTGHLLSLICPVCKVSIHLFEDRVNRRT